MAKNKLPELVFIPYPEMGHLVPTVQLAERLIARSSNQISVLIPIMKFPGTDDKINSYVQSLESHKQYTSHDCLVVLELPSLANPTSTNSMSSFMEAYQISIERILHDRYQASSAPQLTGFVLDMFCTGMMDVADKLGVPTYIFFTSGACLLSLGFRLEALNVDIPAEFGDRSSRDETAIEVAGFQNPVSMNVWPKIFLDKDGGSQMIFNHVTKFRRAKGILVNTFMELESSFSQSLSSSADATNHRLGHIPTIYPVGPILNLKDDSVDGSSRDQIMHWLGSQPPSSVVFLCFGSRGSLDEKQVKEIAVGLERSRQRFLWSLRKQPDMSNKEIQSNPGEYEDFNGVLPAGFLDRTSNVGKVIGWAPQVAVLSHKAVGAFVSHCGWNSTLESLWFGVPMLTWPMYAEQQLNAFVLVKELELAVEIKLDYECDPKKGVPNMIVKADEVEKGIKKMMEEEEGEKVRRKVKEMSVTARKALLEYGSVGSSHESMGRFLHDVCA